MAMTAPWSVRSERRRSWPQSEAVHCAPQVIRDETMPCHAENEDRTHDLRIMRPARYQLRYFRLGCYAKLLANKYAPCWQRAAAADARSSTAKKPHTIPRIHIVTPWRDGVDACASQCDMIQRGKNHSATGTRTRVARVRAEYPNQLDYSGCCIKFDHGPLQQMFRDQHMPVLSKHVRTPLLTFRPTLTPTRCQWLCCHAVVSKDTDGSPVK